jgi:GTP-binding protein
VVNKVDNHDRLLEASEFYSLGFENIFFISSISGSGTGEILDAVTGLISVKDSDEASTEISFRNLRSLASPTWASPLY